MIFYADAHADTLYARAIQNTPDGDCAITAARLAQMGAYLQTFALFAGERGPAGTPYEDGQKMIARIPELGVPILTGALPEEPPTFACGIISIEGGEMLQGRISRLHELYEQVRPRMISLTWNSENEIGHPAVGGSELPLKPFGRELVGEMDALGILVDVSHLNEAGFYDAAALTKLPIVASHSNLRARCEHRRNLDAEQVKVIIEKKGFIGINFFSRFLAKERDATLMDVVGHMEDMLALGARDVLGFGSDFDGISHWPEGLGTPLGMETILEMLLARNHSEDLVRKIAGGNFWRVLKAAERGAGG